MNAIERAVQLKNEIDSLRPLNSETEARIMQKFRLDWNYHSNNLEGNSLTYGETKALILFGITAQGKPLKDHFEITGHNEAINWIVDLVKGETELTESFIRQLHTLLLKESSYKEALTAEGKPTRRKIEVGKYKTMPNHVVTATGETFYFATPEETPAQMHELIEWFRKERDGGNVNPIILAALFHYRFIRIHPFDDGNGRVARILMNFILMQFGYPPVIIKTEDKENYYAVLRLADAGELEPFIEYIGENLVRSLEIMVRGAKGESVEEPDDLDKELALLERKYKTIRNNAETIKSKNSILSVYDKSVTPLIEEMIKLCEKFDKFYINTSFALELSGFVSTSKARAISEARKFLSCATSIPRYIRFEYSFHKLQNFPDSDFLSEVFIEFNENNYQIQNFAHQIFFTKSYSENLTDKEIKEYIMAEFKRHKENLENRLEGILKI